MIQVRKLALQKERKAEHIRRNGVSQVVLAIRKPPGQYRRPKRHDFNPWVGKIPWRRRWQLTLASLPGKSHGQRSLVCYSP